MDDKMQELNDILINKNNIAWKPILKYKRGRLFKNEIYIRYDSRNDKKVEKYTVVISVGTNICEYLRYEHNQLLSITSHPKDPNIFLIQKTIHNGYRLTDVNDLDTTRRIHCTLDSKPVIMPLKKSVGIIFEASAKDSLLVINAGILKNN